MHESLYQHLADADTDPEIRAIVLTGDGDAFCAGADISSITDFGVAADGPQRDASRFPPHLPATLDTPIIAAVNGAAIGLGFCYAAYADLRFAGPSARFSAPFARLGLFAEYGISWLLPRIIGLPNALDLLSSGRLIDAGEAASMGLVRLAADGMGALDAALLYARDLADNCSPTSVAMIRRQVREGLTDEFGPAAARSVQLMQRALAGPDFAEGMAAYREKRRPSFQPRVAS